MNVKVNATHTDKMRMNQVTMYVTLVEAGQDCSSIMSTVSSRAKQLSDFVAPKTGVVFELQNIGLRPHMVLQHEDKESRKTFERVQDGFEAYASIVITVPFGTAKLNPIHKFIEGVNGFVNIRYTLSDTMRATKESAMRFKLMETAMKQCKELLCRSDGSFPDGIVITPTNVAYHVVDEAAPSYKMADKAIGAVTDVADNGVYYTNLDAIYTRENAPSVTFKDSVAVTFDVQGYALPD